MPYSPETTSMALFCDFENVALGVRDSQHEKFDIKLVLERLLLKGSIVVKKAYCDWDRYKSFKAAMHEANFELIEIPHVRQSGKNSADIRLVVDALDLCYTKAHVNTFVIISGDSDFSPLVSKLRENAKQVIGVGVKNSTSDLLTANCDEFIFYDDLVREGQRSTARRPAAPPERAAGRRAAGGEDERRRDESENRRAKGVDLAVQTLEALASERGDGGKIWASVLKEAIKRRKPDFNESYYGFRNFGSLLEEAQSRGLLEVGRDEKANAYVFRSALASQGSPALTSLAADSAKRAPRRGRDRHAFEPAVVLDDEAAANADDATPSAPLVSLEAEAVAETLMSEPATRDEVVRQRAASTAPDEQARATDTTETGTRPRRGTRGGRGSRKTSTSASTSASTSTPAETPAVGAVAGTVSAPGADAAAEARSAVVPVTAESAAAADSSADSGTGGPARPPAARRRTRPPAKKKT